MGPAIVVFCYDNVLSYKNPLFLLNVVAKRCAAASLRGPDVCKFYHESRSLSIPRVFNFVNKRLNAYYNVEKIKKLL